MTSKLDEVKTSGKCQLCTETSTTPQSLPCGHQICANCLQQLVSSSAMTDSPECQSCGLKYNVSNSREGISEITLQADQTQNQQVADQQSTSDGQAAAVQVGQGESTPQTVLCKYNEDGPATVFCTDCKEYYCDECAAGHKVVSRRHTTKAVDEMATNDVLEVTARSTKENRTCADHDQLPLNIVCKNCDSVICAMCALFDHENHFHKELSKCAEEAREDLDHAVSGLFQHIDRQSNVDRDLKKTDDYICASVELAKTKVDESTHRICDIVKTHRAELIRDLDRYKAEARSKLASISRDVTSNRAAAARIKEEMEKLLLSTEALELVEQTPLKQAEFNDFKQLEQENMTWKLVTEADQQSEEALKSMLGRLKLSSPLQNSPEEIKLGEPIHHVALENDSLLRVAGLVVLADCVCVIHFSDSNLWVYSLTTDQSKKIPIPDLNDPRGMVMLPSGHTLAIVDDKTSCKLHFVKIGPSLEKCVLYRNISVSTASVKILPTKNVGGLSLSKDETQLLIGDCTRSKLLVCDLSGCVQRAITVVTRPDETECWPVCATETEGGYAALMVGPSRTSIIKFIDKDGKCTSRNGNKDQVMKLASHMKTVGHRGLVVCECEDNSLRYIDGYNDWSQRILTHNEGIRNPSCVHIDESAERLYVAHKPGDSYEIRVYRWPSTLGRLKTTNYEVILNIGQFS